MYIVYLPDVLDYAPDFWQNFIDSITSSKNYKEMIDHDNDAAHPLIISKLQEYGAVFLKLPLNNSIIVRSNPKAMHKNKNYVQAEYQVLFPSQDEYTLFLLHWG